MPIMAFNSRYALVATYSSISDAARATGVCRQSILRAISGKIISVKQQYWRKIPDNIIIDNDDLGTLSLFRIDKELKEDRLIYGDFKMSRHKMMLESEYLRRHHRKI